VAWVGDYCPTLENVNLAASTVLDLAGFCPRVVLKHHKYTGGVPGAKRAAWAMTHPAALPEKQGPDRSGPWVVFSFR